VANAVNSTTTWTFNGGTSDNKTFNAMYYTIGTPVTGGNVTGVVNYTLNYN
jgi:type 1 fimbria pilin